MARLIYLYHGDLRDDPVEVPWDRYKAATNPFALSMPEQGFFFMWKRLVEKGVLDAVFIVIKTKRGSGSITYCEGVTGLVVPNFRALETVLEPNDIIFCRDGFKWLEQLRELKCRGHPLIFYAAASARAKWDIWDIILEDVNERMLSGPWMDDYDKYHMPFFKPTNPEMFYPEDIPRKYDVCIGASHIHDKKGQWRVVDALIEYKHRYNEYPTCILPGRRYNDIRTKAMFEKIKEYDLPVELPGMVPKTEMRRIYNQSKLFIAPGGWGQNDRNVLEAMRCGTPIFFAFRGHRPPFLYQEGAVAFEAPAADDPNNYAYCLHKVLGKITEDTRKETFDYFEANNGMETVVLPQMEKILGAV